MQATGKRRIEAAPTAIAAALEDADALGRILPSCERVTPAGPGRFDVEFARKAGPMTLRLRTALAVTAEPGGVRRIEIAGRSAVAGSLRAVCTLRLDPVPAGTQVHYDLALETGGLLRRLAAAAAPDAAEKGARRLIDRLRAEVERR